MPRSVSSFALTGLSLGAIFLGCACSGSELQERLVECAILSEGPIAALPLYAPSDCYENCLAAASCNSLEEAICRTETELLRTCDARCAFACAEGSLLGIERVCDGNEDCEGGDDERGCLMFTCGDGREILSTYRCDGGRQCGDGSDEVDCSAERCRLYPWADGCPEFQCADGGTARTDARCNGYAQCEDESDEAGCGEVLLMCPVS